MMLMMYNSSAVEICGDEAVQEYSGQVHPVTEEDWSTEYGDLRLSVKIVDSIYVSQGQIKANALKSGDTVTGEIRPPKGRT